MLRDDLLLRTKLSPPRLRRRLLPRPGLTAKLHEAADYRLTLVQASTGYGKSTALASLAESDFSIFWYSLDEADSDPHRFLSYLIAAFRSKLSLLSDAPSAVLQELGSGGATELWMHALDALLNALSEALDKPSLLVVDDCHFVGRKNVGVTPV